MSYTRFIAIAALVTALIAVAIGGGVYWKITTEAADRRDQTCLLNEGDHLQDVQELRRTYKRIPDAIDFYLASAPERLHGFLLSAISSDLRRLEKEARVDRAPEFCDEPGTGLPEPDPVIPKRPAAVDRALNP